MSNKIDWSVSPFFGLIKDGKQSKRKGWSDGTYRIGFNELDSEPSVGFVPPLGYCVVDADREDAVKKIEELNSLLNLDVFSYKTTRGKHFVYKKPKGVYFDGLASSTNATIFLDNEYNQSKIDIKGGGVKQDGKRVNGFVKVKGNGVWRVDPQELLNAFENAPEAPLSLMVDKKIRFSLSNYKNGGARDHYMFKHVAIFRSKGWTKEQFVKFCVEIKIIASDRETINETIEWANQKWESSIDMGDVQDMTKERKTWDDFIEKFSKNVEKDTKEKRTKKENDIELKLLEWKNAGTKELPIFKAINVKDINGVAHNIINELRLQYSAEDDQIWGIQMGVFKPIKNFDLLIKRWLIKKYGNIEPSVISKIKTFTEGAIPIKKFSKETFVTQFKNKVIDLSTMEEIELDKHTMIQNLIPHNLISENSLYNSHKEEYEFLKTLMNDWTLNNKQLQKQIYEMSGLALTKYTGREKAYFLTGFSENGKSTFLNLLTDAIGQNNISNEDLKELSEDKFSSSNLYGKLANINFDISSSVINDPSLFKRIVSGDTISAAYKSRDKFNFKPYSLMIFGCNNVPYAKEKGDSSAVSRRLEIIPFLNDFSKSKLSDKQKADFKEKIKSEKVIEVFLHLSIKHFNRAINNNFTISKISKTKLEEINREFNHIYDFIDEKGVKSNESVNDAFDRYKDWAKGEHVVTFGINEFVKKYINVARQYDINIYKERFSGNTSKRKRIIWDKKDGE